MTTIALEASRAPRLPRLHLPFLVAFGAARSPPASAAP